jgi:hypothetical protein
LEMMEAALAPKVVEQKPHPASWFIINC